MARYSDFLYSTREYGQPPRGYALSFLEAQALDYGAIQVIVNAPERFGSIYVVVRSANGAAEDPTDGLAIAGGRVTTAKFSIDDSPQPGMVYYTLFVFDDDGQWLKDAATSVLSPGDRRGYIKTLQTVPRMFLDDTLNPLTPFEPNSFMARYLYGVALTVDELSTYTDLILPESRTNQGVRRMSHAWASGLGFQPETEIGTPASFRMHRDAGLIYTQKGLPSGLIAYAEALTGWSVTLSRYENLLPTLDDASFEESAGGWHAEGGTIVVLPLSEDEEEQGNPTFGLPYDYPLSPFSKKGAGYLSVIEDDAEFMLPGPDATVAELIPAQEFRLYVFKVPCVAAIGTPDVTAKIMWYDNRGSLISVSAGEPLVTNDGTEYTLVTVDDQAPEGTRFMRVGLTISGNPADTVVVDRLSLMDGDGPYRDPNTVTLICYPDRVNLLSDPSFEFGGFWAAEQGSLESTEAAAFRGFTGGHASGDPFEVRSERIPALPGYSLTLAATVAGEGSLEYGIAYLDASGNVFAEDSENFALSTSPSEVQLISFVPEGTSWLQVVLRGTGDLSIDLISLDRQERPQVYFDGRTSNVNQDDSKFVIVDEHIYSALYNNRLTKIVRLREKLSEYLPLGTQPRIVLWDSWDDEVRALVPYGMDLNAVPADAPQNLFVLPGDERIFVQFTPGDTDLPVINYSYSIDGGQTWIDRIPESDSTEFTIFGVPDSLAGTERGRLYSEIEDVQDYATLAEEYDSYFDLSGRVEVPVTSLRNGQTYYVRVRGLTSAGYTNPSAVSVVVPRRPPNAPVVTSVEPLSESVRISFLEPDGNGAPVDSYQYSFDDGETWDIYLGKSPLLLEDLVNGTAYSVLLRANNDEGSGPASLPVTFTPRTVPDAPVLTELTPGDRSILVSFDPPAFDGGAPVLEYELSIDGEDTWTPLGSEISSSPFLVQELTNGRQYSLSLRAVNVAGRGDPSNVLDATPRTVPGAPNITFVSASDQALTVAFEVLDNGGSEVTNIDYSVDDGANWVTRSPADPDSPLFIGGLVNGTDYLIRVRATNVAGTGPASNQGRGRPFTRPNPPQNLAAAPDDELVTLTWDPPLSDGGMPIAYYLVTVQPAEGVITYPVDRQDTGAVITELRNGVEYLFTVTATNTGNSTGDAASTKGIPRTVPDAPTDVRASRAVESIPLTWTAPYNGGAPITTYKVRYSADLGTSWAPAQVTGSAATSFTVEDLEPGINYIFQVRATNVAGDGPWSEPTGPISPWATPLPPRNLQLVPEDRRVDATWEPPLNLALTSVTGYIVEYSVTSDVWVRVGTTPNLQQQIFGLTNGVPVNVRVAATGLAGQSTWVTAGPVTPAGLPFAPIITGVSPGDSRSTLYFTINGNGLPILKVQYSASTTPNNFSWNDFSPSITGSPGTITGLTNGTLYYVALRGVNAKGVGPPSEVVTVTPRGVNAAPVLAAPTIIDLEYRNDAMYYQWSEQQMNEWVDSGQWPESFRQDPVLWAALGSRKGPLYINILRIAFDAPTSLGSASVVGYDVSFSGGSGRPNLELRPLVPPLTTLPLFTWRLESGTLIIDGGSSGNIILPWGARVVLRIVTSDGPGPWSQPYWYGAKVPDNSVTIIAPSGGVNAKLSWPHPPNIDLNSIFRYEVELRQQGFGDQTPWFSPTYNLPAITRPSSNYEITLNNGLSSRWNNWVYDVRVRPIGAQYGFGQWSYTTTL